MTKITVINADGEPIARHLTTAAPDLLAALKAVLQDWRADIMLGGVKFEAAEDRMACREGYEQARAAIAKATGAA